MELDNYQRAWQAEAARTRVIVDVDALSGEVQRSQGSFHSVILWRDIREIVVSLLMLVVWMFLGSKLSLPWSWYLTMPALLWVVGFIVLDRRRHPQRLSEPGQPLLYYVRESLRQVEHQIWLLRNVFWWYLLPFTISIAAFFVHVSWQASRDWLSFVSIAGCMCGFLLAIYWWIYRLNQRAVRDQLEPRRRDLLRLMEYLDSESNDGGSGDLVDLVAALSDPAAQHGLNFSWAQNWNRLVPSWRVANQIQLATAIGALGGLVIREWFVCDDTMPELFLPVVGGVIAFEIAFALAWWQSRRPVKQRAEDGQPVQCVAEQVIAENRSVQQPSSWPRTPALCILALLIFVSFMACLVLLQFVSRSVLTPLAPGNSAAAQVVEPTADRFSIPIRAQKSPNVSLG
ncbi:MAG: hypothetical protein KF752_09050 [Pirellulaceae bacterium]|nr:hypothetical protein [Pirellulaceae bacterium]